MCESCEENKENKEKDNGIYFCHLHNHSHYSLLDGLGSIESMVQGAVDNNYNALALTDHGTCAGLYRFQKECFKKGIKPIMGSEFYISKDHTSRDKDMPIYHITIIAKNKVGLENLFKLSSIAEIEGKYRKPRIDFGLLQKHHEGLICTSGCISSEVSMNIDQGNIEEAEKIILQYRELFKDDYYIEIMAHEYFEGKGIQEREERVGKILYKLAKKHDIKAIATNDCHYAKKEDAKYHDILLAMQTHNHIKNPKRFSLNSDEFYTKTKEEMSKKYSKVPELLENTREIVDKISSEPLMEESKDLLPNFDIPEGFNTEMEYLRALIKDGFVKLGFKGKQEYKERIRFELDAIEKCGYIKYFLILWDMIRYAHEEGIFVGPGRGSGAGSLALYCLGITNVDPIKYKLLFERFLNPERISPPDVDIDFDYFRRDEVFDYIRRKYGKEHCAQIGTYNSFKARAVVRYAAKALDIGNDWENQQRGIASGKKVFTKNSLALADEICKQIPEDPDMTIERAFEESYEFRNSMAQYPLLYKAALNLEGTISSAGSHAAGIVACKDPIVKHVPLRCKNGVVCTQFDKEEVEELGLLKFDLLALKTLSVISRTVSMIKERYGKDVDINTLEPTDQKVFDLLNGRMKGMDNKGVFQFESYGISEVLKDIRVDSFEDMVVSTALFRPGPLRAGVPQLYADYKHGRKNIEYLHPKLEVILKDTHGLMVYQEDFMKVAQELAGFTRGQSDTLRKAVGKKKQELLDAQAKDFIEGCGKNGVSPSVAKEIFEQIKFFGGYGFNRSHSVAYGLISYQTSWLKVNYPLEFMCNLLTSEISNNDKNLKLNSYIKEANNMGIVTKKANINRSGIKFSLEDGVRSNGEKYTFIRCPFNILSGVGDKAVESIVENQPYSSLKDFIHRVDTRKANSRVFEALVDSGCMDAEWNMKREELKNKYKYIKEEVDREKKQKNKQEENIQSFGGSLWGILGNSNNSNDIV